MLTEAQVERYSRQILLASVGGRGQERLLAGSVLLNGTGPVFTTAAAYLAASGVPTTFAEPRLLEEPGFLEGSLEAFNPDAARAAPRVGVIGPRLDSSAHFHRVIVHPSAIHFYAAGVVADDVTGDIALPTGAAAVVLGALAAGAMQRLILELGPARGSLCRDAGGAWALG